jgi:hypothetical protein
MDDQNRETSAARVATLPSPDEWLAGLTRREAMLGAFVERAHAWALSRAGGDAASVEVVYPRDARVIAALGVPCLDCFGTVYCDGEGGHKIRYGIQFGADWAAAIWARCPGRGVTP